MNDEFLDRPLREREIDTCKHGTRNAFPSAYVHIAHSTHINQKCWTAAQDFDNHPIYVYDCPRDEMRVCARYAVFHGALTLLLVFQLNIKFKTRNTSIYEYYIIKCESLVTLSSILSYRIILCAPCVCVCSNSQTRTACFASFSFVIWKLNSFVVIATHIYTRTHTRELPILVHRTLANPKNRN